MKRKLKNKSIANQNDTIDSIRKNRIGNFKNNLAKTATESFLDQEYAKLKTQFFADGGQPMTNFGYDPDNANHINEYIDRFNDLNGQTNKAMNNFMKGINKAQYYKTWQHKRYYNPDYNQNQNYKSTPNINDSSVDTNIPDVNNTNFNINDANQMALPFAYGGEHDKNNYQHFGLDPANPYLGLNLNSELNPQQLEILNNISNQDVLEKYKQALLNQKLDAIDRAKGYRNYKIDKDIYNKVTNSFIDTDNPVAVVRDNIAKIQNQAFKQWLLNKNNNIVNNNISPEHSNAYLRMGLRYDAGGENPPVVPVDSSGNFFTTFTDWFDKSLNADNKHKITKANNINNSHGFDFSNLTQSQRKGIIKKLQTEHFKPEELQELKRRINTYDPTKGALNLKNLSQSTTSTTSPIIPNTATNVTKPTNTPKKFNSKSNKSNTDYTSTNTKLTDEDIAGNVQNTLNKNNNGNYQEPNINENNDENSKVITDDKGNPVAKKDSFGNIIPLSASMHTRRALLPGNRLKDVTITFGTPQQQQLLFAQMPKSISANWQNKYDNNPTSMGPSTQNNWLHNIENFRFNNLFGNNSSSGYNSQEYLSPELKEDLKNREMPSMKQYGGTPEYGTGGIIAGILGAGALGAALMHHRKMNQLQENAGNMIQNTIQQLPSIHNNGGIGNIMSQIPILNKQQEIPSQAYGGTSNMYQGWNHLRDGVANILPVAKPFHEFARGLDQITGGASERFTDPIGYNLKNLPKQGNGGSWESNQSFKDVYSPKQDWLKTTGKMIGPGMDLATAIGRGITEPDWKQKMENMTSADNIFTAYQGDRGFNTFNKTGFDPGDNQTPVQFDGMAKQGGQYPMFKEGGEYELDDDTINNILAAGGQIEYLD